MSDPVHQDHPPEFPPLAVLGAREKVAVRFAVALFVLCAILSLGAAIYWLQHSPSPPKLSGDANDSVLLQQFRTQSEIVFDQVSKIFDLFVVKAFLPIFATIIGYLLGKRESGA